MILVLMDLGQNFLVLLWRIGSPSPLNLPKINSPHLCTATLTRHKVKTLSVARQQPGSELVFAVRQRAGLIIFFTCTAFSRSSCFCISNIRYFPSYYTLVLVCWIASGRRIEGTTFLILTRLPLRYHRDSTATAYEILHHKQHHLKIRRARRR